MASGRLAFDGDQALGYGGLLPRLVLVPDRSIRQAVVEARTTCLV